MTAAFITLALVAITAALLACWRQDERLTLRAQIRELRAVVRLQKIAVDMADASKDDLIDDVVDAWSTASEAFDRARFLEINLSELRAASRVLPSLDDPADLFVSESRAS